MDAAANYPLSIRFNSEHAHPHTQVKMAAKLMQASKALADVILEDYKDIFTVDIWSSAVRTVYQRENTWFVDQPHAPWIHELDAQGVLNDGGLLVVIELDDFVGSEIDFTLQFTNGGIVVQKSVNTDKRGENFRCLEEELETLVREWAGKNC